MKPFEYAAPRKVKDATELLGKEWGVTELMAGGTDLVTCLKQGITEPRRVVSLRNILDLARIRTGRRGLTLGAMVTLGELAANSEVRSEFPGLSAAAAGVASDQIMGVGTVGGDLCQRPRCWYFRNGHGLLAMDGETSLVRQGDNRHHAIFGTEGPALFVSASSLGPMLAALGATLTLEGATGATREVPAAGFFRAPASANERETVLAPNEILTQVFVPPSGLRNATYEVRHRHGLDWPYVTASVSFLLSGGVASKVSVHLGHVAATPWPAQAAAAALEGKRVDETSAAQAGEAAAEGAQPLSRNAYKVQLVKTAVKRAILSAAA